MATKEILIVFDNGGTLIDDPFPYAIETLPSTDLLDNLRRLSPKIDIYILSTILNNWAKENATYNFPLAGHFLQEEIWISRALDKTSLNSTAFRQSDIPHMTPIFLKTYRNVAANIISMQPQINKIRNCLQTISGGKVFLAVASNDRAASTRTMLAWAGIDHLFDYIVTSEELSSNGTVIEKPNPEFFVRMEQIVTPHFSNGHIKAKIYVGDNETNDVEAPRTVGYTTIRYINRNNPSNMTWLDYRNTTSSDYCYSDPDTLAATLDAAIRSHI